MYKVIQFDDGIIAVPTKWIDQKKQICKWLPYLNNDINEAIKDAEDVRDNWIELPILQNLEKPSVARFPNGKGKNVDKNEVPTKRSTTLISHGSNETSSDSAKMFIREESHALAEIENTSDKQRANSSVSTGQLEAAKNQHYKFLTTDEKLNYIIGLQEQNLKKKQCYLT